MRSRVYVTVGSPSVRLPLVQPVQFMRCELCDALPVSGDVEHREPSVSFLGVKVEAAQVALEVQLRQCAAAVAA